jgi:hypothetical protein
LSVIHDFWDGLKIFLSTEFHIPNSLIDAPVAQGIERQPPELKVAGSNPAGRTRKQKGLPADRQPFYLRIDNLFINIFN